MNRKVLIYLLILVLVFIGTNVSGIQPYKLVVTTDKEGYTLGDVITIKVKVMLGSSPVKGTIVGIELRDPKKNPVLLIIRRTDENGTVQVSIKTNEKWPTGKYVVWVALSGTKLKATTSFFLVGLGPYERMFIVSDNNGLPLVGAKVIVLTPEYEKIAEGITKSDGIISFNLTVGNYIVRVLWGGTMVYEETLSIEPIQVRFTLNCTVYSLKVVAVEMLTKRLLIKTPVSLELPNGTVIKAFTNEVGVAVFRQVPKGTHRLTVAGKVVTIVISKNTEVVVEVEPSWLWILLAIVIIIVVGVIYVIISKRRR